jgi:hypothetical protein
MTEGTQVEVATAVYQKAIDATAKTISLTDANREAGTKKISTYIEVVEGPENKR